MKPRDEPTARELFVFFALAGVAYFAVIAVALWLSGAIR